jgi:hypothetical protein
MDKGGKTHSDAGNDKEPRNGERNDVSTAKNGEIRKNNNERVTSGNRKDFTKRDKRKLSKSS